MTKKTDVNTWYAIAAVAFVFIYIVSLFQPKETSQSHSVNKNDQNYHYAKSRIQAEGYSEKDADVAAQAIIKFQKAQENRK